MVPPPQKRRRLLAQNDGSQLGFPQLCNCVTDDSTDGSSRVAGANPRTDAVVITEKELELLSEEEKLKLHEDIYGFSSNEYEMSESEEFLAEKLQQLDFAIHEIKNEKLKKAYYTAIELQEEQGISYVNSRKFCLMFLRAEKFHVESAALRLLRFLTEKLKLFGISKLVSAIKLTDLDEHDKEVLYSGYMYMNNTIDQFGRLALVLRRQNLIYHDIVSLQRAVFYLLQNSIEKDEKSQKTGIIVIAYNVGFIDQWSRDFRKVFGQIRKLVFKILPFRIACLHQCYSQASEHVISSFIVFLLPREVKLRYQLHYGLHEKCQLELSTYRINIDLLPINMNGEYKFEMLRRRLDELQTA